MYLLSPADQLAHTISLSLSIRIYECVSLCSSIKWAHAQLFSWLHMLCVPLSRITYNCRIAFTTKYNHCNFFLFFFSLVVHSELVYSSLSHLSHSCQKAKWEPLSSISYHHSCPFPYWACLYNMTFANLWNSPDTTSPIHKGSKQYTFLGWRPLLFYFFIYLFWPCTVVPTLFHLSVPLSN